MSGLVRGKAYWPPRKSWKNGYVVSFQGLHCRSTSTIPPPLQNLPHISNPLSYLHNLMTSTATPFQRFIRRPILTHTYIFYNGHHIYFCLSLCFSTIHRFFTPYIYRLFLSLMIEKLMMVMMIVGGYGGQCSFGFTYPWHIHLSHGVIPVLSTASFSCLALMNKGLMACFCRKRLGVVDKWNGLCSNEAINGG